MSPTQAELDEINAEWEIYHPNSSDEARELRIYTEMEFICLFAFYLSALIILVFNVMLLEVL